jgi:two-component system CheB/CheR fusion protein
MDASATRTSRHEPPAGHPPFPIVGIGASAGGLEAFTQLFEQLPAATGMAYLVVQHLDPSRASLLPPLLARATKMPVCEAQDDMAVEPDHVYVIPPNADLTLAHGRLKLLPRTQTRGQHFAIDTCLRSLAHECKQQAIGVLLSGTATDGTIGLQAIKAEGGITFVQDVHSARFPQMPQSAIAAGCVDQILPPAQIASSLARLSTHPYVAQGPAAEPSTALPQEEQALTSILLALRNQTGVDFLAYKPTTLKRRIAHRMAVLHIERLADYATYLSSQRAEVEALYQDVLIHVTSFFRDPEAFLALRRLAFPQVVERLAPNEPIRIWVAGCSSGQETYSLLICLLEFLEERSLAVPIQLFATDINAKALSQARTGIYAASALETVSPERLERFFTPIDRVQGSYRISKDIRERCVFALHNMAKDPPFSHLDLVSCRNVLIYLGQALQQRVLLTFHYALKPQGFLLLGNAESVGSLSRLFAPVERRQKLYSKQAAEGSPLPSLIVSGEGQATSAPGEGGIQMPEETSKGFDVQHEADQLLLANYAPASVVVDTNLEILHVRGHTSPYLELAPGKVSFNLVKMARGDLGLSVRSAIHGARKANHVVTKEGVQVSDGGTTRQVRVTAVPLKGPETEHYFLVLFEETLPLARPGSVASPSVEPAGHATKRGPAAQRIAALEQELAATRAEMAAMLQERDAANQELESANEETLASNEELQSLTEELETSKEELQAINEELTTTNQQLEALNEQFKEAQEYAEAIVETVREPLVVLDADLRVARANATFYQCFRVEPSETVGYSLFELGHGQWNIPSLHTLLEELLSTEQSFKEFKVEHDFPNLGHKILQLSARRILREGKPIKAQPLLLAMEDITERKGLERQKNAD